MQKYVMLLRFRYRTIIIYTMGPIYKYILNARDLKTVTQHRLGYKVHDRGGIVISRVGTYLLQNILHNTI